MAETWSGIVETNNAVPGILAPTGTGLLAAGTVAEAIDGLTALQLVGMVASGVIAAELIAPAIAIVAITSATTFVVTGAAFEIGVGVESFVRALGRCTGYQACCK